MSVEAFETGASGEDGADRKHALGPDIVEELEALQMVEEDRGL